MTRLKRWIGPIVAIVVVVAFIVVLPRIADPATIWDILTGVSTAAGLAIAVTVIINILSFAPPWMAAMPGLGFGRATVVTHASTAASIVLPGGDVVGMGTQFAMLRGWGFAYDRASLAVLVTGVWNQLVRLAFPVIAVVLLALTGDVPTELRIAGAIGAIVFVVLVGGFVGLLASDRVAHRIGGWGAAVAMWGMRLIRRPRTFAWGDDAVRFRASCEELVRRRWAALTITTVFGHLSVFAVLLVTLRAVGVEAADVSAIECFAAWSLVRLLTAVPITPGGIGIVELGLTGGLVAFGGEQEAILAGVLLFRALTVLPVIATGAVCFLLWRRTMPEPAPQSS